MQSLVSIVIRTYNESKYINICLNAIKAQSYKNYEIILVDSGSKDDTTLKSESHSNVKVYQYKQKEYIPGLALNYGVSKSKGSLIVFLSAHCIPCNKDWLKELIKPFKYDTKIAGVYGRQLPLPHSKPEDIRDLMNTFGIEERIQKEDTFFHNANSIVRKSVLEKIPFSNVATNIEDRIWASEVIKKGYHLYYSPLAKVFHHHGIHQYGNTKRLITTNKVISEFSLLEQSESSLDPKYTNICACIPVRNFLYDKNEYLIYKTIRYLSNFSFINKIILFTNSRVNINLNGFHNVEKLKRSKHLDKSTVSTYEVLKEFKKQCKSIGYFPDLVVYMEEIYPYRENLDLESFIFKILNSEFDSIVPSYPENRMILLNKKNSMSLINSGFIPSEIGSDLLIASKGSLYITYTDSIDKELSELNIGTITYDEKSDIFKKFHDIL